MYHEEKDRDRQRDHWRDLAAELGLPAETEPATAAQRALPPAEEQKPAARPAEPQFTGYAEEPEAVSLEPAEPAEEFAPATEALPAAEEEGGRRGGRRRRGRRGSRRPPPQEMGREAVVEGEAGAEAPSLDEMPAEEGERAGVEEEAAEEEEGARRRRRRRSRARPAREPESDLAGASAEEEEEESEAEAEEEGEAHDEEDSEEEPDNLADWSVPSWQELISSLYRPER
jgi:hypothetical protein